MTPHMKARLADAMEALRTAAAGLAHGTYALSGEVKTATAALREASSVGLWTGGNPALASLPDRDALLVMTFGTTFRETRAKTIEAAEAAIAAAHPDIPLFEAYTSHIIIDRVLAREGVKKDTPEEAFARLKAEGYTRAAVVSFDIIPGMEYEYKRLVTRAAAKDFKKVAIAAPLLYFQGTEGEPDHAVEFLLALAEQLPPAAPDHAVLLMAHGTPHPANAYYAVLQDRIRELGLSRLYVYSVEGQPDLEDLIPRLHAQGVRRVTLVPMMMVAGDHATNDMASNDPDSHKSRLEAEGFAVDAYLHGLGENPAVRALFAARAEEALAALRQ